jgi:hypothetical protein
MVMHEENQLASKAGVLAAALTYISMSHTRHRVTLATPFVAAPLQALQVVAMCRQRSPAQAAATAKPEAAMEMAAAPQAVMAAGTVWMTTAVVAAVTAAAGQAPRAVAATAVSRSQGPAFRPMLHLLLLLLQLLKCQVGCV